VRLCRRSRSAWLVTQALTPSHSAPYSRTGTGVPHWPEAGAGPAMRPFGTWFAWQAQYASPPSGRPVRLASSRQAASAFLLGLSAAGFRSVGFSQGRLLRGRLPDLGPSGSGRLWPRPHSGRLLRQRRSSESSSLDAPLPTRASQPPREHARLRSSPAPQESAAPPAQEQQLLSGAPPSGSSRLGSAASREQLFAVRRPFCVGRCWSSGALHCSWMLARGSGLTALRCIAARGRPLFWGPRYLGISRYVCWRRVSFADHAREAVGRSVGLTDRGGRHVRAGRHRGRGGGKRRSASAQIGAQCGVHGRGARACRFG